MSDAENEKWEEVTEFILALVDGKSKDRVVDDMVRQGWQREKAERTVQELDEKIGKSPEDRKAFADAIHASTRSGSGEQVPSWLIWVGLLMLINILAVLFDWPFFVY